MKKEYTCADVEQLLREIAAQERDAPCECDKHIPPDACVMDDAMTQRFSAIIAQESARVTRISYYKLLAHCAAVVLLASVGIYFLSDTPMPGVTAVPVEPMGKQSPTKGLTGENRTLLSHLDATTESGFSPVPQETYDGREQHRYGVSVYGHYEYTACTDTL